MTSHALPEAAPNAASTASGESPGTGGAPPPGEIEAPSQWIEVDDPATGAVIGRVPDQSPAQVRAAVARARAVQPEWSALGFRGRAAAFRRARHWLLHHREELVRSIVRENGKAPEDAVVELIYCLSAFAYWARKAPAYLAPETVRFRSPFVLGRSMSLHRHPRGVVGVIGPWNNPLLNSFGDAIPALAAGNAVVLKPSEHTPLTALLMQRMAGECAWPTDVFQVITGAGATGSALVEAVDFVMFTGSTRTGRAVAARAAQRLVPCSLELGGKDPLIVLADAPLERAVNVAVHGALSNGGQLCTSVERVYVEAPLYDDFVAAVTRRLAEVRTGPAGRLGQVDVGAMTFPAQLDVVQEHLRDAVAKGARILAGGEVTRTPGRFVTPTLLVDVDHTMLCMREETFGPTLPVMKVADADEAVRLANDSPYGLQATVLTGDPGRGRRIAARLEAGCVTINDAQTNYFALGLPMGGWKESGLGARHGAEGIRKYTRTQAVTLNRFPLRRDVHMMPYRAGAYRLLLRLLPVLHGPRPGANALRDLATTVRRLRRAAASAGASVHSRAR
ncbi:MAG TPA: aldehyde dehydrogenase family protein [Kineosporiaceae bacterium]